MEINFNNTIGTLNDINERIYGIKPFKERVSEEEYENHDCHLSEEDGCGVCDRWFEQGGN